MALRHPDRKEEGGGGWEVEEEEEEEEGMEWEREKKKKKNKGKEGSGDPLEVFGTDLMLRILNKLDSSLVSRHWHLVASSDPLWSLKTRITKYDLCDHAWKFHFSKRPGSSNRGTRVTDTAEYLIENCKCTCVGVQRKGQNAGYLLTTKT